MKCRKCGEELPDRARFCFVCGEPIDDVPAPKRLEEPLDPLAAGAVQPLPIAPPPRAYRFEAKQMRTVTARAERRSQPVSQESAELAARAERGFVFPLGEFGRGSATRKAAAEREREAPSADEVKAAPEELVEEGPAPVPASEVASDATTEAPAEAKMDEERPVPEERDSAAQDAAADVEPADETPDIDRTAPIPSKPEKGKGPAPEPADFSDGRAEKVGDSGDVSGARVRRTSSLRRRIRSLRGPELALVGVMGVAAICVLGVMFALATSWIGPFAPRGEEPPVVQPPSNGSIPPLEDEDEKDAEDADDVLPEDAPEARPSVNDYSWEELSQISALIADASTDAEGLEVAEHYNLCDSDGTLDGTQVKEVELSDGVTLEMRVAGFRADERSDGEGLAGITFIAGNTDIRRPMGSTEYLGDGWTDSELRAWMEEDLAKMLPTELTEVILTVDKRTNTPPEVGGSQVTTEDTLWLPAYSEVVGPLAQGAEFYNSYESEGEQYQLFSDTNVSWGGDTSSLALGVNWWLRSPDRSSSIRYLSVLDDGTLGWRFRPQADHAVLVSFCV